MRVADLNRLFIADAHVPNFVAVDGELLVALELAQKFGELELNVLCRLLLFDPLRQLSLDLLCVQETSLVHLLVFLLEIYGFSTALRTQFL